MCVGNFVKCPLDFFSVQYKFSEFPPKNIVKLNKFQRLTPANEITSPNT